jgi:uncharacterized membrane protein
MTRCAHLWAVGFDGTGRAAQVRDEIIRLAGEGHDLTLLDAAVAVRYPDGCLTLDGGPFPVVTPPQRGTVARLLARLALGAPPLSGAAVGPWLASVGAGCTAGISDDFVRDVEGLIRPGTSVLFLLDEVGNMDAVLRVIRGLGGTVLKTSVDLEQARLIRSALAASAECRTGSVNDP